MFIFYLVPQKEDKMKITNDKGSLTNKFGAETESSSVSNNGFDSEKDGLKPGNVFEFNDDLDETEEDDDHPKRPPKIWISKSASMEHDLE